jgi:hypothetical protein
MDEEQVKSVFRGDETYLDIFYEQPMQSCAFKVAHVVDAPIILATRFIQLDPQPLPGRELWR